MRAQALSATQAEARAAIPQTLDGRTVVVTGTVPGYTREEAEAAIVARGGKSVDDALADVGQVELEGHLTTPGSGGSRRGRGRAGTA